MRSNTIQATPRPTRLRVFVLYADFPAGILARRAARRIAAAAGPAWDTSLEMWKLDSIPPVGSIRNMITHEAAESDVLLIAVSAADRRDLTLNAWLDTLVHWKSNRLYPGFLVGIMGGDQEVDETSSLVRDLASFAKRTGMDLDWTWYPGVNSFDDFQGVAGRVCAWLVRRPC